MPASAMASARSGVSEGSVLVEGSVCTDATPAAGAAVGVALDATIGVAVDATIGVAVATVAAVGAIVGVAEGATVNGGRVGGMITGGATTDNAVQLDVVNVSLMSVTSPFRANARPWTVTPFASVMDVRARIVPTKVEPEPRVAELVTCQKTLQELPPLMKTTRLVDAVMRSDVAWKIQTEFGSF
jgi:hypothetical protein